MNAETRNRHHARRPTGYTPADHARQRAAVAAWEARIAAARRRERLARLAYWACALALAVSLFYAAAH